MTRILFVLRHAQSVGKQSDQHDYDRVLTAEGEVMAKALGKKLKQQNYNIDLILSSRAARSRQTVEYVNEVLQLPDEKIQFKHELYEASMVQWMDQIHQLPDDVNHVMLVGHNPSLSILASNFTEAIVDLAPCELVAFEFKVDSWKEINNGQEILNIT